MNAATIECVINKKTQKKLQNAKMQICRMLMQFEAGSLSMYSKKSRQGSKVIMTAAMNLLHESFNKRIK
jgi:hypothetical protein